MFSRKILTADNLGLDLWRSYDANPGKVQVLTACVSQNPGITWFTGIKYESPSVCGALFTFYFYCRESRLGIGALSGVIFGRLSG
jgi:hypothetical protein